MWGPKGMPKEIVGRWNKEVAKVINSPEMKKQMANEGLDPAGGPPDELQQVVARDVAKWRRVIKEAKIERVD
jgi:tripartite-type tricarboxylate transporter receptor subunit TctC